VQHPPPRAKNSTRRHKAKIKQCLEPSRHRGMSPLVGASSLAMDVNDGAGDLIPRGVLLSIASELAPTGLGSTRFDVGNHQLDGLIATKLVEVEFVGQFHPLDGRIRPDIAVDPEGNAVELH
jgi:hypothetical protein